MTTLRQIVYRSLRQIGAKSVGEEYSPEDFDEGLEALIDLCERLPDYGAGRKLVDVLAVASDTAINDQRILLNADGLTITMPDSPKRGARVSVVPILDGATATIKPNSRLLEGATDDIALTEATTWIYREDTGNWVKINGLDANSQSPYPKAFDRTLAYLNSLAIFDEFATDMTPTLMSNIAQAKAQMYSHFSIPSDAIADLPGSVRGAAFVQRYGT